MKEGIDDKGNVASAFDCGAEQTQIECYSSLCDQQLLELIAKQRDRDALSELYQRFKQTVGSFLKRKTCEDKLVDEVYNDVMLIVWDNASKFRGESKVSTWIFGIAYHTSLTHNRKELRHSQDCDNQMSGSLSSLVDDNNLEQQIVDKASMRSAIGKLSQQHKIVIELAYFYGHNLQEISDLLGCPLNTVKTRLFHARKQLKQSIEMEQNVTVVQAKRSRSKSYNYCYPSYSAT